jgi:5-methylcytosine-specific restriction endonuclease McrA
MTDYYSHLGLKYKERSAYRQSVLDRDEHICQVCGAPATEVDHIVPWSISHDSSLSNLRAICIKCNRARRRPRKDARLPWDEWCQWLENELVACQ